MRGDKKSTIDYVLVDSKTATDLVEMIIDDSGLWCLRSDHNWIQATVKTKQTSHKKVIPAIKKWRVRPRANWEKYRETLHTQIEKWEKEMEEKGDPETMAELGYRHLISIIQDVAEKTVWVRAGKMNNGTKRVRAGPMMRQLRQENKKAERKWKWASARGKEDGDARWRRVINSRRKMDRQWRKQQKIKRKEWNQTLIKKGVIANKKFWNMIKQKKGQDEIDILLWEEKIVTEPEQIKQKIAKYVRDLGEQEEEQTPGHITYSNTEYREIFNAVISELEVKQAIKEMGRGKAPGPDGITDELIIEAGDKMISVLQTIFECIRVAEWVPPQWAQENTKLLHKGKDKRNLDNYRTISLGNIIGKIFARIWNRRITYILEKDGWLGEMQGGFRKDRSTIDQLFTLTTIMNSRKNGEGLVLMFIDFRKAFDRVNRSILWKDMEEMGMAGKGVNIIKGLYIGHNKNLNTIGGQTGQIRCDKGVKQGGIISPNLFAIYMIRLQRLLLEGQKGWKIDEGLSTTNIPGLLFADDLVVLAKEEEITSQAEKVLKFCEEKKMELNLGKTKIMDIGIKKKRKSWRLDDANGNKVGQVDGTNEYKYLGLTLDRTAVFRRHLTIKLQGLPGKIGAMKAMARDTPNRVWAADEMWSKMLKKELLYGSEVITYTDTWIKAVEIEQNKVGRWILGLSSRAPTAGVRAELGWTSVLGEIYRAKVTYWARLVNMNMERWTKKVFLQALGLGVEWKWRTQAREAQTEFKGMFTEGNKEERKDNIKVAWIRYEERRLRKEIKENSRLNHYSGWNGARQKYIDGSQEAKILSKFRLNDFAIEEAKGKGRCKNCQDNIPDGILRHILAGCRVLNRHKKRSDAELEQYVRKQLNNTSKQHQLELLKTYTDWSRFGS